MVGKINKEQVLHRYAELYDIYSGSHLSHILEKAESLILDNRLDAAERELNLLDTKEQLLDKLQNKLRNKAVWTTLKRIQGGKAHNIYEEIKGWSSLLTHLAVECEDGNFQYAALISTVYAYLGKLLDKCKMK